MPGDHFADRFSSHCQSFGTLGDQPYGPERRAGDTPGQPLFASAPCGGTGMLVIRRKAGEAFHIGDSIEVEILEVGTNQVKIGIKAPREIAVLRNEVFLTER